ncbi:MAG: LysM peptidoglycan-binding domain-containing protein [Caldilineaceae bacterium]
MFMKLDATRVRRTALLLFLCFALTATLLPTAASAAPAAAPAASGYYHIVKHGETLSHIARYYGVTINALKYANHLSNANYVYVGQKLYIPADGYDGGYHGGYDGGHHSGSCSSYYYVRHGDKLSKIAAWYGMKTSALASANPGLAILTTFMWAKSSAFPTFMVVGMAIMMEATITMMVGMATVTTR